ncbi:serine hydrolase domain-containing protein [Actinomycetospora sp. NBC_00405]|uniref:serine hydrolase domain-containing protein n=1 Tax=Actinomycetospora sp. NBC_00405 TaxID=2975952 RepID=UPI002E1A268A
MDRIVPRQLVEGDIPGALVTVVAGGRTVFSQGYGSAHVETGAPMDAATTGFYTASLVKLFTATAVLQLVQAGKLDLHTDVNAYLQGFSVPDTYPGRPVTVHHLLTYTSGFDNNVYGWAQWDGDRMPSLTEFAANVLPGRVRAPGELVAYNNYDYALLGRLVEIASGRSYASYVAERVFAPLGMRSTSAAQPHPPTLEGGLAAGHRPVRGSQTRTAGQQSPATPAGADVITTSPDLARFMIAQLRADPALGPGVPALMQRERFTSDASIPGMGYAFEQRPHNGHPVAFKDGDLPGLHTDMALLPDADVGIHVVYNGDGHDQAAFWGGKELIETIIDESFPADVPERDPLDGDVSRYAGEYEDTRTSRSSFARVGSLTEPVTADVAGGGQLTTNGLSEDPSVSTQDWVQIEPGLFRLEGGTATMALDDHGALVSSQTPAASYVRLDWYRSPQLHLLVAGAALAVLLLGFFLLPVQALIRRHLLRPRRSAGSRSARVLAWATSLCAVLFGAAFGVIASDANRLMQIALTGDPVLSFALNTVSVMGVLTVAVAVCAVVSWCRSWWTWAERIAYSGYALAAVGFVGIAVTYRLLGAPLAVTV